MFDLYHIDIDEDYGGVSGYVVDSNKEQVGNYLSEHTEQAQAVALWLAENVKVVGLLKNLNVDEDERGNGYGSELLEQFIEDARGHCADAVILIADAAEDQLDGFELEGWYHRHGFDTVCKTGAGPLMVYPEQVADRLRAALNEKAYI